MVVWKRGVYPEFYGCCATKRRFKVNSSILVLLGSQVSRLRCSPAWPSLYSVLFPTARHIHCLLLFLKKLLFIWLCQVLVASCRAFRWSRQAFWLWQVVTSLVVVRALNCPMMFGVLVPWSGIELMFPALPGRFLTAESPGRSPYSLLVELAKSLQEPRYGILLHFNLSIPRAMTRSHRILERLSGLDPS